MEAVANLPCNFVRSSEEARRNPARKERVCTAVRDLAVMVLDEAELQTDLVGAVDGKVSQLQ